MTKSPLDRLRAAIAARTTTATSEQLTAPHLRVVVWCLLALLWVPVVAYAAPAAAAGALDAALQVSPALVAVAVGLSSLAGATALLVRIDRELSAAPDKPLPRPWLFCSAHMSGSWLAGTLAFLLAQHQVLDVWLGLGLVIAMSFVGAKTVEAAAERMLPRVLPSLPPISGDPTP